MAMSDLKIINDLTISAARPDSGSIPHSEYKLFTLDSIRSALGLPGTASHLAAAVFLHEPAVTHVAVGWRSSMAGVISFGSEMSESTIAVLHDCCPMGVPLTTAYGRPEMLRLFEGGALADGR